MEQVVLTSSDEPRVAINMIAGDLRLTGWERGELHAESPEEGSLTADQHGEEFNLTCRADCAVRLPRRARVTIEQVGGDARVKSVEGALEVKSVGGDLVLRQTSQVAIGQVGGDVSAKRVQGPMRLNAAGGDVSARSVAGDFEAQQVSGDLYLRDVAGGARARAAGDVLLSTAFAPGREYDLHASGDILCRVPANASARFDLHSSGEIAVDLPGAQTEGGAGQRTVTLDGGAVPVRLRAAGDITLTALSPDPGAMEDFGEHFGEEFGVMAEEFASQIESQIGAQIESQMAEFEKLISERLGAFGIAMGPAGVKAEEVAQRVRRAAERAGEIAHRKAEAAQRRAEAKAEAAQRRAEAKAETAQRRVERHAERARRAASMAWGWDVPSRPSRPTPPVEPVSDEERLAILRMVEQKKISVADAEKLLAALEGK